MALNNPVEVSGTISTFGNQFLSTKRTNPSSKFGTGDRTKAGNEPEWIHQHLGATSGGFGGKSSSGIGPQLLSRHASAPSLSFGLAYPKELDASGVPGPGAYNTASGSVGQQPLSMHETAPTIRIGTGGRFSQGRNDMPRNFSTPPAGAWRPTSGWLGDAPTHSFHGQAKRADVDGTLPGCHRTSVTTPGAGAYEQASSFGEQCQSTRQSMPTFRMSSSPREQFTRPAAKQYHSGAHEREMYGSHSPGPTRYSPKLAATSQIRSVRCHGFGSSDRFSDVRTPKSPTGRQAVLAGDAFPGPGSYVV